ncbi:MAG: hypothetical protein EAX95_11480 [Candidatus Thorarchaeota archaeon]|nr:hypothetical protein [Candidatus Thorarchaeota archaeon]
MRRLLIILVLSLLFVQPTSAYAFNPASYTQNGLQIVASVEAALHWESPFNEEINISVTVISQLENITETTLSDVLVTVHSTNTGEGYLLLASKTYSLPSPVVGSENVSTLATLSISGSGTGDVCYFGISVEGTFTNATGTYGFSTISPENLIGPFGISLSITSPQFLVGLGFIIFFLVVTAVGVTAARRTRIKPRRRPLLQE